MDQQSEGKAVDWTEKLEDAETALGGTTHTTLSTTAFEKYEWVGSCAYFKCTCVYVYACLGCVFVSILLCGYVLCYANKNVKTLYYAGTDMRLCACRCVCV